MSLNSQIVTRVLIAGLPLGLAAGCSRSQQPPAPAPASAPALATGGAATTLPAGHPPIGAAPAGGHGGAPVGGGGMSWTKPAAWESEAPSSGMRQAQYRVGGPAGDAQCVVYYFGAGEGGDATANAERWASQFTRADGTAAPLKTTSLKTGGTDVLMVEVEGVYHGGPTMGEPAPRPRADSMLLGAIAKGPDANWFFKFTGPAATVRAQRAAFEGMIRSLGTKG
jgi:hypothetical protein